MIGLSALDADDRQSQLAQAVIEHRRHPAGLKHDPRAGRSLGERRRDIGRRRRHLHFIRDGAVSVHDTHMRLRHRDFQPAKILHVRSPLPMMEPILSASRKSCRPLPNVEKLRSHPIGVKHEKLSILWELPRETLIRDRRYLRIIISHRLQARPISRLFQHNPPKGDILSHHGNSLILE